MNKKRFVTIPDAPDYEINGYFKIRNKLTGKILKLKKPANPHHTPIAVIHCKRYGIIQRTVTNLYEEAVTCATTDSDDWDPINSLGGRYEFNPITRQVRNSRTKKLITPKIVGNCTLFKFCVKHGVTVHKSIKRLLEEMYEIPHKRRSHPVPIIIREGSSKRNFDGHGYSFKTIKDAAKFLSEKTGYVADWCRKLLNRRIKFVGDYKITYLGS